MSATEPISVAFTLLGDALLTDTLFDDNFFLTLSSLTLSLTLSPYLSGFYRARARATRPRKVGGGFFPV